MTAVLTTAGAAHLVELAAGGMTTNSFNTLILGTGNDAPSVSDVLESLTERIDVTATVLDGYPKLDDQDARNTGRGASVWTWRFEIPSGSWYVASNAAVTNYSGGAFVAGAPLAVHAKQVIAQRQDERLIVWVNARTGEAPTVVAAPEQAFENRIQRVVGYAARNRALAGHPAASVIDDTTVRTRPQPGQHSWTAAHIVGVNGETLSIGDVDRFTLRIEQYVPSEGDWVEFKRASALECHKHILGSLHYTDQRFTPGEGYNVSHTWMPPRGTDEGTWRLTYEMRLCDGDVRRWVNVVEVRP